MQPVAGVLRPLQVTHAFNYLIQKHLLIVFPTSVLLQMDSKTYDFGS